MQYLRINRIMTSPSEEGDPQSRICILGEAPSYMEIRQNRPLVGPSGQLLEQCMHAAGIVRRECYLINIFPYEVKKRDNGKTITNEYGDILWDLKIGLTDLGNRETKDCVERLSKSGCNVIVPLGSTALNFLTGKTQILKYRGSILWSRKVERKCIPTIHPAASLRGNYMWRHYITSDLRRAKEHRYTKELRLPDRKLIVSPSFEEVMEFLGKLNGSQETAFDIELVNHQVYCISFSLDPLTVMSIPFVDAFGGPWWSVEEEVMVWEAVAGVLSNPNLLKIAHNAIFDTSILLEKNNILVAQPIADTMIAHHIIWPDLPKGLDFLCSMHTDEPYYKDEGKQWNKVEDPEKFRAYNAKDSAVTHEVWNAIQGDLDRGYRQTYDETMAMLHPFLFMMRRGLKVDHDRLEITKEKIIKEIEETELKLFDASEYEFNVQSPKQCQEYFYITKGIKPYISRATGRPTTDDKAMSRIWRKYHLPEAKLVQELRGLKKLFGTYLDVGIDKDNRVRCSYNLRGTVTGRPSSSQTIFGTGMNLQNLHPQFKEFLISDEDQS